MNCTRKLKNQIRNLSYNRRNKCINFIKFCQNVWETENIRSSQVLERRGKTRKSLLDSSRNCSTKRSLTLAPLSMLKSSKKDYFLEKKSPPSWVDISTLTKWQVEEHYFSFLSFFFFTKLNFKRKLACNRVLNVLNRYRLIFLHSRKMSDF